MKDSSIEKVSDFFWTNEYKKQGGAWTKTVPKIMLWFGLALKYKGAIKIADIGCGCGRNTSFLAKMGFSVTGIDLNELGLLKARAHSMDNKLSSADFVRGSAGDLPLKHDLFGGAVCLFILHLLAPPMREKVILELQRVLNKKGKLCIAEYVSEGFSEEDMRVLLKNFSIIELWYEKMPLLSRPSPPLRTVCVIAENKMIEK